MNDQDCTINFGNVQLSAQTLKTIMNLQENDNEAIDEHINRLSNVATWIGKHLDGFDPTCQDDKYALRSIVAISNTVAMLQNFRIK